MSRFAASPLVVATRVVHQAEREFEVNALRCGDLLMWPLIRLALWHQINRAECQIITPREIPAVNGPTTCAGLPRLLSRAAYEGFVATPEELPPEEERCDALFYTRGEEYKERIDGRPYNRFVEPLISRASSRWRCQKMLLAEQAETDPKTHWGETLVLTAADFIACKHSRAAGDGNPGPRSIEKFAEFQHYMRGLLGDFELPESYFVDAARAIDDYQAFFTRLLSLLQPRAVFLTCYYQNVQMALIRACKFLGITSVDLQHGSQAPYHQGYDTWHAMPPTGYDTLPDVCWVWGPYGADSHGRNLGSLPGAPRAVVGGCSWLNDWLGGDMIPPVPAARAFYGELERFERRILLTWSPVPEAPPPLLLDAMRRSPPSWRWLLRLHPLGKSLLEPMKQLFAREGIHGVELEHSTGLPLYALLRRCTHHVTRLSTVVFEGLAFQVPSAMLERCGPDRYQEHLRDGVFAAPSSADELLGFLRREPAELLARERLPYFDTDEATTEWALAALLEPSAARSSA